MRGDSANRFGPHVEVHAQPGEGQLERHVQRRRQQRVLQHLAIWTHSIRCSTMATPGSMSGIVFSLGAIWNLPLGGTGTWAGGWQLNAIFTARSGYPFSVFDCTNGLFFCMRAIDTSSIDKKATGGPATGNPNEFDVARLDADPRRRVAATRIRRHGTLGLRAVSCQHDRAQRVPRSWRVERGFHPRQAVPVRHARQRWLRLEAYNLFNHHNMYVHGDAADVSSFTDHRLPGRLPPDAARVQVRILIGGRPERARIA